MTTNANSHHAFDDFLLPKGFARRADASRHDLYRADVRSSQKKPTTEPDYLRRTDSELSMYGREEEEDFDDNTVWNSEGEQVPLGNINGRINRDIDLDEPAQGGDSTPSSPELGSRVIRLVWLTLPVDEWRR